MHHQRRLDAEGRAIAGIDPLDLARHQPIADIARAGAAIGLGQGRAEEAGGAHLVHDRAIETLLAEGGEDARPELRLGKAARGIADEPLLLGELVVEAKRIGPVEGPASRELPEYGPASMAGFAWRHHS